MLQPIYYNIYKKIKLLNIKVIFIQYAELPICLIREYNNTYISKSKISGKGLFAKENISKNTRLGVYIDNINGHNTMLYNNSYYINHSKNPNLIIKMHRGDGCYNSEYWSIRDIKKNEELFVDYTCKILLDNYPELGEIIFNEKHLKKLKN